MELAIKKPSYITTNAIRNLNTIKSTTASYPIVGLALPAFIASRSFLVSYFFHPSEFTMRLLVPPGPSEAHFPDTYQLALKNVEG